MTSQFQVTTTMVLNLMERDGNPVAAMAQLLSRVHESEAMRRKHVRRAIDIYLSLRTAGVLTHVSSAQAKADGRPRLRLAVDLPDDFALNQPLAPFALAAMDLLGVDSPSTRWTSSASSRRPWMTQGPCSTPSSARPVARRSLR